MREGAAAVPALVDVLEDDYEPLRRNAIYALGCHRKTRC